MYTFYANTTTLRTAAFAATDSVAAAVAAVVDLCQKLEVLKTLAGFCWWCGRTLPMPRRIENQDVFTIMCRVLYDGACSPADNGDYKDDRGAMRKVLQSFTTCKFLIERTHWLERKYRWIIGLGDDEEYAGFFETYKRARPFNPKIDKSTSVAGMISNCERSTAERWSKWNTCMICFNDEPNKTDKKYVIYTNRCTCRCLTIGTSPTTKTESHSTTSHGVSYILVMTVSVHVFRVVAACVDPQCVKVSIAVGGKNRAGCAKYCGCSAKWYRTLLIYECTLITHSFSIENEFQIFGQFYYELYF